MNTKKIFFDLDGTLLDTWARSYKVYVLSIERLGGNSISITEFIDLKRNGIDNANLLVKSGLDKNKEEIYNALVVKHIEKKEFLSYDTLYDWVKPTLGLLKSNYDIYLLTSRQDKMECMRQIVDLEIGSFLTEIFIEKNKNNIIAGFPGKNVIIITDNEDDIILGNAYKLITIAVTWGHRNSGVLANNKPTFIAYSHGDLLCFLT